MEQCNRASLWGSCPFFIGKICKSLIVTPAELPCLLLAKGNIKVNYSCALSRHEVEAIIETL